jgi:hypothetical protein
MKKFLVFVLFSSLFVSCFQKKEDPIEREKKQMKEFFDNSKLLVTYKGIKIALRVDYTNTSKQNVKVSQTGLKTLSAIAMLLTTDTFDVSVAGIYNTYQQLKGLYELKKEINHINEDDLPTILNRLSVLEQTLTKSKGMTSGFEKDVFGTYNNSTEHFILGCLWFITRSAPADIYVYEASQVNTDDITKSDQHILAGLLKALVCCEREWFYTSEKSSTEYIEYITKNKKEVLEATEYLDSIPNADPEKRFYELRSMGYALRAYAKDKSGRDGEANKDYSLFVDDFEKADFDNKELCFVSTYICIKNSKNEQAEHFLRKMANSKDCNKRDLETIAELRSFIKNKNNKEFNKYLDNFSLSRIAFGYIYGISVNSDMAKQLASNRYSKQLIAIPAKVNGAINYSGTIINTDSLASKAEGLVKGFFK